MEKSETDQNTSQRFPTWIQNGRRRNKKSDIDSDTRYKTLIKPYESPKCVENHRSFDLSFFISFESHYCLSLSHEQHFREITLGIR